MLKKRSITKTHLYFLALISMHRFLARLVHGAISLIFATMPSIAFANTFYVTSLNDSGVGSLRQAIIDANNSSPKSAVNILINGTVQIASQLPQLTNGTSIYGSGQSNFTIQCAYALCHAATGLWSVNGNSTIQDLTTRGFYVGIHGANGKNVIQNVTAENNAIGIYLNGSTDNRVTNSIARNNSDVGIIVQENDETRIEGTTVNGNTGTGIVVRGGTFITIDTSIVNNNGGHGISQVQSTLIGGSSAFLKILNTTVTGNVGLGILIEGKNATIEYSQVLNNGACSINCPHKRGGIFLTGSASIISFSKIQSNIGNGITSVIPHYRNHWLSNNIFGDNTLLGIDLGNNGITPNDGSAEPDRFQNAPELSGFVLDSVSHGRVTGRISTTPLNEVQIQFYLASADSEGKTLLGIPVRVLPGSSTRSFTLIFNRQITVDGNPYTIGLSDKIIATADTTLGTSEFSNLASIIPSKIGTHRQNTYFSIDTNGNGIWDAPPDFQVSFGATTDIAIRGDWDGDGKSEIGVYRPASSQFYMDKNGNGIWDGPSIDSLMSFGTAGDKPIIGDWNGDGKDNIGVYRPSNTGFYRDVNGNGIWDGTPIDAFNAFGASGDTPIIGRW